MFYLNEFFLSREIGVLHNRLPTKDNLVRQHVLHLADNVCVGGCGSQETANHLLFGCHTFSSIWSLIFQWHGISFVAPFSARDHFFSSGTFQGYRVRYIRFFNLSG